MYIPLRYLLGLMCNFSSCRADFFCQFVVGRQLSAFLHGLLCHGIIVSLILSIHCAALIYPLLFSAANMPVNHQNFVLA